MQMLGSLAGTDHAEGDSRHRVGCSDQTASPDWRFSQIGC